MRPTYTQQPRQAIFPIFGRPKRKSLLEQLITDNNSLECETILSCCGGKTFKSTLMPTFVKRYHEAFFELDLGLVSPFNIGQTKSTPF